MADTSRLQGVIELMQEAALVLAPVPDDMNPTAVVEYRAEMVNRSAAELLGVDEILGRTLVQLLPEDTALLLRHLCERATESCERVEHFAAAPDPLTDLGRAPTVSVHVTHVDDLVLCTWLPGWLTAMGKSEWSPITARGSSTADRLEFADAVDALGDAGFGVFSLDLMSGRLVGSSGMHRIFGGGPNVQSGLESAVTGTGAWQALLRQGEPMDAEVKLSPQLGGHSVRVVGRATYGADGHPVVVRGSCSIL